METNENNSRKKKAWSVGWGWLVTIPLASIVIIAATKGFNDLFCAGKPLSFTAIDLLKERYVKGEIDKEEFDQKLRDILSV